MQDRRTIIYIGGFELPDKNAAAHRVLNNGKVLRELGYNVVFIGINKTLNQNVNILDTKTTIQGFTAWSIPYPNKFTHWINYVADIKMFKTIFEIYRNDTRFIIAYNYPSIGLYQLKKHCRSHECKIIADCTEWYSVKYTNLVFRVIKGLDSFFRMRVIHKKMDGLIVISRYLENYYKKYLNVLRIPPLVDMSEDKWSKLQYNVKQSKIFKIVYSGSTGKNKDKLNKVLEILCELKEDRQFIFNLVGLTREEYLEQYPNDIKKLEKLNDYIIFHGRKNHIDSLQILAYSDICIFIRQISRMTRAGFPTKFVECISSGVPVITTRTSDLEEYVIDGKNGFFININDTRSAVNTLKNIIDMPYEELYSLRENSKRTNKFNYKDYITKFNNYFSKL